MLQRQLVFLSWFLNPRKNDPELGGAVGSHPKPKYDSSTAVYPYANAALYAMIEKYKKFLKAIMNSGI